MIDFFLLFKQNMSDTKKQNVQYTYSSKTRIVYFGHERFERWPDSGHSSNNKNNKKLAFCANTEQTTKLIL